MATKYVKYVDVSKCDGCRACMVACKNWNDLPAEPQDFLGTMQSHANVSADTWNVLTFIEHENSKGDLDYLFRHSSCYHCTDAACEKVCPENAISYTENGMVVVDQDACVGCGYCVQNCPFDVIQLKTYKDENGKEYRKAHKCTMCTDRLDEGLQPACVTACHTDSLEFGDRDEMLQKAEKRVKELKERYPNAQVYNPPGVGGTHTIYVLTDNPSVFGMPENPKVPTSAVLWKDYAQPIGKAMVGGVVMALAGAYVGNKFFDRKGKEEQDGGSIDE